MKTIGIDLGGTSIYGGIINDKGQILKRVDRETGKSVGADEVLRRISLVIDDLLKIENDIIGIGIGSPGFIDTYNGKVLTVGGNIEGWAGTDIKGKLSKKYPNHQIFVGNDANVAGICEGWIGAGKDFDSYIMITLGTGLGGAIYTKKQGIWYGQNFQGGELGHAILYPNGRKCTCGQNGCVEQYISGTAIEKLYFELTGKSLNGKEIFRTYDTDNNSKIIIDNFAKNLAIYISSLKNIFDPEGIVIGGGVINSKDYWWDLMVDSYRNYVNDPKGLEIVPAIYLNDAGMIGAGKLALDNMK
ncbi:ROK family protein [Tissierella sp. Yu-01]|uniref:ROK family protein n=1 Tax=Tissierella sp. Yu-01 TaxID=3035694 RepID=UPI00321C226D